MRKLIVFCGLLLATLNVPIIARAAVKSVHADYKTPLFTIPFTTTPPTIDGTLNNSEWNHALSINALQTTEAAISTRQTRVWMMWDADNLYLAMRSPLRPGERVVQANRQTGQDNVKAVFDDAYEIFLNADTLSPDGEKVFFQYLGNAAGVKYDVMFEPTVGNSRPGWESGWKPANRITPDGKSWEMEVAIPRQSIYRNTPFTDGAILHGLFVRDFKDPWEQNSIGGSGSFSVPETHCNFVLSKSAPAIHLLGVADAKTKTLGLDLTAQSKTNQTLKWTFQSDSGITKTGDLALTPGKLSTANPGLNLDKPGEGYYRIQVASADGSTKYLDWSSRRAFGDFEAFTKPIPKREPAALNLTFNPVENYVRVEGDFINYDNRDHIDHCTAEVVDSNQKSLAQQNLTLDNLAYVHGLMHLGDCPPGSYTARLTCYDSTNKQLLQKQTTFVKKDPAKEFPWWNTTAGNIEKPIAPWTPLKHEANRIDVWGRTMQIGPAGLPSQITTQGEDILAAPIQLIATPNSRQATPRGTLQTEFNSNYRAKITTTTQLSTLNITTHITTEFDGLYKVQLTLTPQSPTPLNNLKIVIPIKPEFASYFHACGEGIRYGFSYGYLPHDKTGQLWTSKQVDGQPMLAGSFIPYVWIGNDKGGLCWFADSDQGWLPNDQTPAIEIRRDSPASVNLVLNLISSKFTLDEPRTITFAFQATPVKPIRPGWRMDTWSTGDSFKDFCRVEPKGGHLIWNALPFTLDTAACKKMVEERDAQDDEYNFGVKGKYHLNSVPYFENNGIDKKFAPAVDYFADQWHARISDSLCYDKSLSDFLVWNLGKWCKETGIDGWYVDNVRPVADDNIDAGRGYKLPDGRIQPTYQMFATREFFLRVRAVFAENGKTGKFVLHMTNHMILPWIGAADTALDGEDHVTFPEMNKDFIDFWSPQRMRLDYPANNGVPVSFLEEYQGKWTPADLKRVTRAYTAMCIVNDVMPSANPNGQNQEVWRGRDRFGIESPNVQFIPYWNKSAGFSTTGNDNLLTAAWTKPGSILIAITNRGQATTADLHVDLTKLGLTAHPQAMDADTGAPLEISDDGQMKIPVARHDYRQILLRGSAAK